MATNAEGGRAAQHLARARRAGVRRRRRPKPCGLRARGGRLGGGAAMRSTWPRRGVRGAAAAPSLAKRAGKKSGRPAVVGRAAVRRVCVTEGDGRGRTGGGAAQPVARARRAGMRRRRRPERRERHAGGKCGRRVAVLGRRDERFALPAARTSPATTNRAPGGGRRRGHVERWRAVVRSGLADVRTAS